MIKTEVYSELWLCTIYM